MNFLEALSEATREVFCTSLRTTDEFWGRIGAPGTLGIPGFQIRGSLGYRLFCNREPPPLPQGNAGGQCPVPYAIQWIDTRVGLPGTSAAGQTVVWTNATPVIRTGPIRLIPGTNPVGSVVGGHSAGSGSVIDSTGMDIGNTALETKLSGPANTNITSWRVVSRRLVLSRVDGLPDDCGDPTAPVPVPPNPPTQIPVDVVYVDPDGGNITVPVVIAFAIPFVFINGQLNAPFRVQIPLEFSIPIDGTINLETGDINFNFGGGSGGGGGGCLPRPPSDYAPTEPPPPPPPGTEVPPEDIPQDDTRLKTIIVGAIVTTQVIDGKATVVNQASNPDIYIPRVANLQFAIQIGNSVSWTERVNITSLRQFVPCPWEGGAIDVRITSEPGFQSFVTPVTGKIPDDQSYEALN